MCWVTGEENLVKREITLATLENLGYQWRCKKRCEKSTPIKEYNCAGGCDNVRWPPTRYYIEKQTHLGIRTAVPVDNWLIDILVKNGSQEDGYFIETNVICQGPDDAADGKIVHYTIVDMPENPPEFLKFNVNIFAPSPLNPNLKIPFPWQQTRRIWE
jgi:hypothetical protein